MVFVVLSAACTGGGSTPTPAPGSATDVPAITTLPAPTTTSSTSTTTTTLLPPVTTGPPLLGLAAEVESLIDEAEGIRGLGFLTKPEVVLLSPAAFLARVDAGVDRLESADRDEARTAVFRLAGLLGPDEDLAGLHTSLFEPPQSAWYDAVAGQLVVAERADALSALARSEIVHEVVHAITDQHYRWWSAQQELVGSGADDRAAAFDALVEGDATYFQIVYIEGLPAEEREEIALGFVEPRAAADTPQWVVDDVAFPFGVGFDFVADLVAGGGIAAVDRAYADPPISSEHILHPERYRRGESPMAVGPMEGTIDGYTALPAATLGEWSLRSLLSEVLIPGVLTQTADGWGGDTYQVYVTGGGEAAFAYLYVGDGEAHTIEVTQAFLRLAEDVLQLGEGERSDGGEVFERNGRPWMFVDREGSGLLVVIASEPSAGADLMSRLAPP